MQAMNHTYPSYIDTGFVTQVVDLACIVLVRAKAHYFRATDLLHTNSMRTMMGMQLVRAMVGCLKLRSVALLLHE